MSFALNCVVVFLAAYALDYVWAKYTRAVAGGSRGPASAHAGLIIVFNAVCMIASVNDWAFVVPAVLGAAAGTWHSVGKNKNGNRGQDS